MYYVRDHKGVVKGPFSLEELDRMAKTRRFARHNKVSEDRVTWLTAAEHPAVQRILGVAPTRVPEPSEPPVDPPGPPNQPEPPPPPPPPRPESSGVAWLVAAGVAALSALGVLVWVLAGMFGPDVSSDDGIRKAVGPSLVTVQGLHPREGKKRCYAVVVSRNLAVAPLLAATLDAVKIEARHGTDESEWHSAHLMTADPVTGLCVLRADFGRDVKIVDLPDKKSVPSKRAELRFMTADPSGDCDVDHGALATILDEDEPDEKLQVELDKDMEEGDPIGRSVFDSKGLLVGMEVGRLSKSESLCVSAYEIRAKKKEAAKIPADHRLERIDLPEAPAAGPGQMPPGQTPDEVPTEEPVDQGKDDAKDGRKKATGSPEVKTADAVRGLARAAKGIVDDAVPLPELTAKERKELGDRHREQVLKEHRPVRDEKVQTRIRKIVDGLLKADGRKTKDFTVNVVQDSVNNAYAFVGGNIIVNEGFLAFAGTDDEMIHYVLGHEIGHVVKGHVDMPFRRQKMAGGLPGGSMAADAVSAVLANSAYSQGQEEDADCFSVELLRKMRISTAGGVRFFTRLNQQAGGKGPDDGKDEDEKEEPPADDESADDGGRAVRALFGSHPDHDRRIELLTNGCGT